jgi:hypothetical protein
MLISPGLRESRCVIASGSSTPAASSEIPDQ